MNKLVMRGRSKINFDKLINALVWIIPCTYMIFGIIMYYKFPKFNPIKYVNYVFHVNINLFSTISTVLVGICFSIISILLTADQNSLIVRAGNKEYKKIMKSVEVSFILSIIYIFSPLLVYKPVGKQYFVDLLLTTFFLYLITQVLRIWIYFHIIIKSDVDGKIESLKTDASESKRNTMMIKKIYNIVSGRLQEIT
ncbi:hypothetical protein [Latilactobacillus curvatus]